MLHERNEALTVGAITDPAALELTISPSDCDLIEIRLDALQNQESLADFCQRHQKTIPLLFTARDPAEGGLNSLSQSTRENLLREFSPFADAIDIEFANLDAYETLLNELAESDVTLIYSSHNFQSFDHLATVEFLAAADQAGAHIAKAAVTLNNPLDFSLFESLCETSRSQRVSLMGMGRFAPASRLLAAQHRSLLNYGFLGNKPTAPGQWPARLLKDAIAASPPF
ncbi:MAG: type I 3-dehydroquinate dehydratase [Verrucomicrobiota bacterium]